MIEFRESDHSYWYDGVRVPGVSEIIDGVGLMDPAANSTIPNSMLTGVRRYTKLLSCMTRARLMNPALTLK